MAQKESIDIKFSDLNLPAPLLAALDAVGYETPSPIQAKAIPHLLAGLDLLGHAPTGTGKTAAFALPLIARLDKNATKVQVLTLAPTRELAIQVAEAFQKYGGKVPGFRVVPIYGGQDYGGQLRQLKRGVQVVVGTPGRVMDHMRRGTLKLDGLQALVLDEADEMLRMGFIEEVEWILEQTPKDRQMALFSATMPREIERIARRYLNNPQEISIKAKTATAETIRQRYWKVTGFHKLDALTRILEVEQFEGVLIFVRTKTATVELAERLEARGYSAAALNGDMAQKQRENMVARLKSGSLDIVVATDVAARGLDVDRISHVINFDIPHDTESYIHRIGRTGRAGRSGEAILFVAPRERRMLQAIERATRQTIEKLHLPSTEMVNNKRIADFKQKISDTLASGQLSFMRTLIEQYQQEHDVPAEDIAAALAMLSIGDRPLLMPPDRPGRGEDDRRPHNEGRQDRRPARGDRPERGASPDRGNRPERGASPDRGNRPDRGDRPQRSEHRDHGGSGKSDLKTERYRIDVGHVHGVKPGNIVGAIANEAGLDSQHMGYIEINEDHSFIDLPQGMPKAIFQDLKKVRVCGQKLDIALATKHGDATPHRGKPGKPSTPAKDAEKKPKKPKKPKPKKPKKPKPKKPAN